MFENVLKGFEMLKKCKVFKCFSDLRLFLKHYFFSGISDFGRSSRNRPEKRRKQYTLYQNNLRRALLHLAGRPGMSVLFTGAPVDCERPGGIAVTSH